MKKSRIFLICCFALILGTIVRCQNLLPLGNSCMLLRENTSFSPDRTSYIKMKLYMCGFFKKKVLDLGLIHNNSYIPIDINDYYIHWSGKPYFTWTYHLPKVIWRNNQRVDIYMKSKVLYGDVNEYLTDKDFKLIIHYELENK